MQKINLKKTTKDKLYAALLQEGERADAAEKAASAERGRADEAAEELAAAVEKLVKAEKGLRAADAHLGQLQRAHEAELTQLRGELDKVKDARDFALAAHSSCADSLREAKRDNELLNELLDAAAAQRDALEKARAEDAVRLTHKDALIDELSNELKRERAAREVWHDGFTWCMEHPWRNLWSRLFGGIGG